MAKLPFTRLSHPDPETNRVLQDVYDKLATVAESVPIALPATQPVTSTVPSKPTASATPTFLVSSLTALPNNNPTTGQPYSNDGVVIQLAPLATDHGLLFRYSTADFSWHYMDGQLRRTQSQLAALAAILEARHVGLLVYVTDFAHLLRWTGAAWEFDNPSDFPTRIEGFFVDPGTGWHVCDGTAGVAYLKADGTTATVTVPSLVTNAAAAAYLKLGSPSSLTPVAAVAPTFTGGSYTPAGTVSQPTFSGTLGSTGSSTANIGLDSGTGVLVTTSGAISVSNHTHTHTDSGHAHSFTPVGTVSQPTFTGTPATITGTISATGEPRNILLRPYFRV